MMLARMGPAGIAAAPDSTAVAQEEFSYKRVKAEEALKGVGVPTYQQTRIDRSVKSDD